MKNLAGNVCKHRREQIEAEIVCNRNSILYFPFILLVLANDNDVNELFLSEDCEVLKGSSSVFGVNFQSKVDRESLLNNNVLVSRFDEDKAAVLVGSKGKRVNGNEHFFECDMTILTRFKCKSTDQIDASKLALAVLLFVDTCQ